MIIATIMKPMIPGLAAGKPSSVLAMFGGDLLAA
jgi:hypothetical protein